MADKELIGLIHRGVDSWNQWREANPNYPIDLTDAVLAGLNLVGINLNEADLTRADLTGANLENSTFIATRLTHAVLRNANLSRANLIAANLTGAKLQKVNVSGVNFLTAMLRGIDFSHTDLRGHDLRGQDLRDATLVGADLSDQNFTNQDLSRVDFSEANLERVNFENANLLEASFHRAKLKKVNFHNANLRQVVLSEVDLRSALLKDLNFEQVDFSNSNLQGVDFSNSNLMRANLTGCKLGEIKTSGWKIKNIKCDYAYWDQRGVEITRYHSYEFERLYSETMTIDLHYSRRLNSDEITTLPFLIEHLEASHWGCVLRLKSIDDVLGGTRVTIAVDETGGQNPTTFQEQLKEEAHKLQLAQLRLRQDQELRLQLKEALAEIKNTLWPRMLELAADDQHAQVRRFTVLLLDLKDFSRWKNEDLSEKLSLFRGLIKPILHKFHASYPNMEGDSVRVTFQNATAAVACACMIQRVLGSAGFSLRIGMDLGNVKLRYNEVTELMDLEGEVINYAARLEATAKPGQILVTDNVRYYVDSTSGFRFEPVKVALTKAVGDKNAGDIIECFTVHDNGKHFL
ncbi:MAG: pentapeptide repeat-containing protein [Pseudomonadota bacterium]